MALSHSTHVVDGEGCILLRRRIAEPGKNGYEFRGAAILQLATPVSAKRVVQKRLHTSGMEFKT